MRKILSRINRAIIGNLDLCQYCDLPLKGGRHGRGICSSDNS